MPRPEPLTYQRGATSLVRTRRRIEQAGEELRRAVEVLEGGEGWPRGDPSALRAEIALLLARLSELERSAAEVGSRW